MSNVLFLFCELLNVEENFNVDQFVWNLVAFTSTSSHACLGPERYQKRYVIFLHDLLSRKRCRAFLKSQVSSLKSQVSGLSPLRNLGKWPLLGCSLELYILECSASRELDIIKMKLLPTFHHQAQWNDRGAVRSLRPHSRKRILIHPGFFIHV